MARYRDDLVGKCSAPYTPSNWTLLHKVEESDTVKMIVQCLSEAEREEYIMKTKYEKDGCSNDYTALHIACMKGHIEVVRTILSLNIDIERLLFMDGLSGTALHTASTRQIAETLVNAVSVENRSKFILTASLSGNTALHETSKPDVAEYLLSLETRVQVKTVPYDYICANSGFSDANEFVPVNKLLLSIINKVYGETPLLRAIHASNASKTEVILQWMVQKGLDIHSFLHYRYRPKKNAFDIARQLHGDEPKELMTIITKFYKPAELTSADLTSNDKYETVDATEIPLSHTILEDSYLRDEVATLLKSDRSWHQLTRGEVCYKQTKI